jgi:hypothetical protein
LTCYRQASGARRRGPVNHQRLGVDASAQSAEALTHAEMLKASEGKAAWPEDGGLSCRQQYSASVCP